MNVAGITAMIELAPASYSAPNRPAVVCELCTRERGDCRCASPLWTYLHIHDAEYMRQRAEHKKRLAAAHPDAGGSSWKFRDASAARRAWLAREVVWYARLGLTPPDNAGINTPGVAQNIRSINAKRQARLAKWRERHAQQTARKLARAKQQQLRAAIARNKEEEE